MPSYEEKYYRELLKFIVRSSKLSSVDVGNLLKDNYINLNKLKGSKQISCLFPNCSNIGVESSHLFSAGFLKIISENGTVYAKSYFPHIQKDNLSHTIEKLGVSKAMTFPGFCKKCEQKFTFEKNKAFNTSNDYFLQLFRTICYEKRIIEIEIANNEKTNERLNQKFSDRANLIFSSLDLKFTSIVGSNDIELFFKHKNNQLRKKLKRINTIYNRFVNAFNSKISLTVFTINIPAIVPFFAGYVGDLLVKKNQQQKVAKVVLNLHPTTSSKTELFLVDFNNVLNSKFFSAFKQKDFLNFFAAIIDLSDNWVVNKTYWDTMLTEDSKKEVLKIKSLK